MPPQFCWNMAKISWILVLIFLWLSVFVSDTAMVKIHRAIPRNSKLTRAEQEPSWLGFEPCKFLPDLSTIFINKEAWLYSIPATILVGLCGIFPLLVIPVEAGHALREGGKRSWNVKNVLYRRRNCYATNRAISFLLSGYFPQLHDGVIKFWHGKRFRWVNVETRMFFTNLNWGTTNVCYEIFKKKLDLGKSTRDIKRGFSSCSR